MTVNPDHVCGDRPQAVVITRAVGLLPELLAEVIRLRKTQRL